MKGKFMKVAKLICIAAFAVGLTPTALADKYDDLAAKEYRWVNVNGPFAYRSRDDLRQIDKDRSQGQEFELIEQLRAYYLIPGTLVQVIQSDTASGTSQIQLNGLPRSLWTFTRFLSLRPIADLDGRIETPFEPSTTLNNAIGTR
jgi:hypothetical protein